MSNPPNPQFNRNNRNPFRNSDVVIVGECKPRRQAQELRLYQTTEELVETREALAAAQERVAQLQRKERRLANRRDFFLRLLQ